MRDQDADVLPGHPGHGEPQIIVAGYWIVEPGDYDAPARVRERGAGVAEKREARPADHVGAPGLREAVPIIMVPPDEIIAIARVQRREERLQRVGVVAPPHQVSRNDDHVGVRPVDDLDGTALPVADRSDVDVAEMNQGQVWRPRSNHRQILDRADHFDPVRLDQKGVDADTGGDQERDSEQPEYSSRPGQKCHARQYKGTAPARPPAGPPPVKR